MSNELKESFAAQQAVSEFKNLTGVDLHPTNPGQILKRLGVDRIGYFPDGNSVYDGKYWNAVFDGMFNLSVSRNELRENQKPITPKVPLHASCEISKKKPFIDYKNYNKLIVK